MSKLLASVKDSQEALLAVEYADIIDLKNPSEGALGAVAISEIKEIVVKLQGRKIISATVGDLPMLPELLLTKIRETADTGVDIVKIGFFASSSKITCIQAIGKECSKEVKLVAVLFAEDALDLSLLKLLKQSGFYGVMLDTAIKNGKNLLDYMSLDQLQSFVQEAKLNALFTGLAGSLKLQQLELFQNIEADYLGFRGALCALNDRQSSLCVKKLKSLIDLLYKNNRLLHKREVSI